MSGARGKGAERQFTVGGCVVVRQSEPTVVVGLPVFNGEKFLGEAIESVLTQSFSDFRLILIDNGSTDSTPDICARYAAADRRIVHRREPQPRGAANHFNQCFQPGGAPYFKWMGQDEFLASDYLARMVALLRQQPDAVIAHGRTGVIDEGGRLIGTCDDEVSLAAHRTSDRFWRALCAGSLPEQGGLMRAETMARTRLHGGWAGSERNFMIEMVLLGPVIYDDAQISARRESTDGCLRRAVSLGARQNWCDPSRRSAMPAGLAVASEALRSIRTMPIAALDRVACSGLLGRWTVRHLAQMASMRPDPGREEERNALGRIRSLESLGTYLSRRRAEGPSIATNLPAVSGA